MGKSIRNRHDGDYVGVKICGNSDKKDKQAANRKFRRRETLDSQLSTLEGEDMFSAADIKEVSNNFNFRSDGLAWFTKVPEKNKYKYKNK